MAMAYDSEHGAIATSILKNLFWRETVLRLRTTLTHTVGGGHGQLLSLGRPIPMARVLAALLPLLMGSRVLAQQDASSSNQFANDLEQCILNHAQTAIDTLPSWANSCMPPTQKIDVQANVYKTTLNPMRDQYGCTGALW